MSMAMALQGVRDYLRTQNSWSNKQCGIREEGEPIPTAGEFYIALDEGGVNDASGISYYLGEYFDISVYVWRRIGRFPPDAKGDMLTVESLYLESIYTLEKLERIIIKDIHNNWGLASYINTHFGLPDNVKGDIFLKEMRYMGRTSSRTFTPPNAQQPIWNGRALRFRGLKRNQKIGSIGS